MLRFATVILALAFTSIPQAWAGQVANARILSLGINRTDGYFAFVRVDNAVSSAASCSTNCWQFTLSLDGTAGKEMYSVLLAAKTTGALVAISGTGDCQQFGSIESVQGVQILE